ncbi:unnamed protein product [Adineta ricciae]|uniref:Uncharacterized protein n=1 Tax=Adineta ricciae TaxID=249248 RepID=A0A815RHL6_ADIRI|nr:unnamed protein product [Adineta ricciae]
MHQHHRRATNDCYEQMMIHELKLKKCKLSRLYRMVRNFKALICLDLYHLHTCRVDRINHRIVASKELEIKENHQNKLNKFRNKQRPANELNKSTLSPITNPSKRILTDKEISILENGLNFVLPTDKFDEMTFISNIEAFFVELLGHYIDKRDYEEKDVDEKIKYNLTPIQLQFANRVRSVCNTFLNTFEIVEVDETITQEDKLIRKLKQLRNEGFITEKEFNFCRP